MYLLSTQSAAAARLICHRWIRGDTATYESTHPPVRIPGTWRREGETEGWRDRGMERQRDGGEKGDREGREREGEGGWRD